LTGESALREVHAEDVARDVHAEEEGREGVYQGKGTVEEEEKKKRWTSAGVGGREGTGRIDSPNEGHVFSQVRRQLIVVTAVEAARARRVPACVRKETPCH